MAPEDALSEQLTCSSRDAEEQSSRVDMAIMAMRNRPALQPINHRIEKEAPLWARMRSLTLLELVKRGGLPTFLLADWSQLLQTQI